MTPATKAATGHDVNITEEEAAGLCGVVMYEKVRSAALELYSYAAAFAEARGLIVADTKFELGLDPDGTLTLGDEALTPDSSRFWPLDRYAPGGPQPSFDKQFVRDWCESVEWDKTAPGPALPDSVVAGTRGRYIDAFERLTGLSFATYLGDPEVVLACA